MCSPTKKWYETRNKQNKNCKMQKYVELSNLQQPMGQRKNHKGCQKVSRDKNMNIACQNSGHAVKTVLREVYS